MKICENCLKEYSPTPVIDGKRRILYNRKFCFDCSPFGWHNTTKSIKSSSKSVIDRLSKEEFKMLVAGSRSRGEILFKLKLKNSGYASKILNRRIESESINISHFIKGGEITNVKIKDENVYVENSFYRHIRDRFFNDKIVEYKCSICNILPYWNNLTLTLQLDHINGNRYDNRKENLRWVCPNCHTQTKTFGSSFYYKKQKIKEE